MKRYLSLIKFAHTIFAMPFALLGFFMGAASVNFQLSWWLLLKVILCMVFARSAAMSFNRYIDRDIDILNARTAIREIPAGTISPQHALIFTIATAFAFVLTCYFVNRICFLLSPVALAVILGYSFTKRFTALCHIVLGIGLALAPVGAYLAVTAHFAWQPVIIGFTVLTWVAGFDIIYALQDEEFDSQHNLYSVPRLLGKVNALRLSSGLHVASAALLLVTAFCFHTGLVYQSGTIIFILLIFYQHMLVKPNDLSKVNMAFFTTNGIASIVFGILAICDIVFLQ
ncbi:MAG: UbiA family prenyltransferase [Bacteroidetes bacterium]|nr:UbiA family prenyltransferase [Bacteroidota bacterium]